MDGLIDFVVKHRLGDIASVAGFLLSVIGFIFTISISLRAKRAAEKARDAAEEALNGFAKFDAAAEVSLAVSTISEIKRMQRQSGSLPLLLERYSSLRVTLIRIRGTIPSSDTSKHTTLQRAVVTLRGCEELVEDASRSQDPTAAQRLVRINRSLNRLMDDLQAILTELRRQAGR